MLDYIEGTLAFSSDTEATIDHNGLGYRILISSKTHQALAQLGSKTKLYLSQVIREDSHRYFGFLSREAREFFEILIELSGIGPKTALAILGQFDPGELVEAATLGDVQKISKVPGIGKKTAERLVVELKGKNLKIPHPQLLKTTKTSSLNDALSALMQLGFNFSIAQKALLTVVEEKGEELELSELIKESLQKIR